MAQATAKYLEHMKKGNAGIGAAEERTGGMNREEKGKLSVLISSFQKSRKPANLETKAQAHLYNQLGL